MQKSLKASLQRITFQMSRVPTKLVNRSASSSPNLIKTCLYDFHIKHEAKMVGFAGYSMPLQYKSHSIIESNNWVREKCGLFDVSHMLQFRIHGIKRKEFIHSLTVIDMDSLDKNHGTLSLFTNQYGGIMDDTIINNCEESHYYVVSNAGCADKIKNHLLSWQEKFHKRGNDVRIDWIDKGLIALQGPKMSEVLQPGLKISLKDLYFGQGLYCKVFGIPNCRVTRCGYTGEDGVEISVPKESANELAEILLSDSKVIPVGLGARDSLRLEAGLCLYGNDIDENRTPVESRLSWTIGSGRKNKKDNQDFIEFPGYDIITAQMNKVKPVKTVRVGFLAEGGPPARQGTEILSLIDKPIGVVTSGCFSPYLSLNISMGYIDVDHSKIETRVKFKIRDKLYDGFVAKLPFVKTKYYMSKSN